SSWTCERGTLAPEGVDECTAGLPGLVQQGNLGRTLVRNAIESDDVGVAGTDLVAIGFGVDSLTLPLPFSLDSTPLSCLHVVMVITVPLTTKVSSESNNGTPCHVQMLEINKEKRRLLLSTFSMHLKVSSMMIHPTLIFRPTMIECKSSMHSSESLVVCCRHEVGFEKVVSPSSLSL
ncbi:hypothetical protein V6N12_038466, partial [Hibiscus sabdariffa]